MAIKYQRGTVVLFSQVRDRNGVNPKDRPVVLVRDFDDAEAFAFGVAVTGEFDYPLPATSILLPYSRTGKCKTGLTKESVAVCNWVASATKDEILARIGFVPSVQLVAILQQVTALLPPKLEPT